MRRHRDRGYFAGGYYRICDLSGRKVRARDTVKLWNGLVVAGDWYEARNPQDFVRGVADNQRVPEPRPEAEDVFLGVNEVTADDL